MDHQLPQAKTLFSATAIADWSPPQPSTRVLEVALHSVVQLPLRIIKDIPDARKPEPQAPQKTNPVKPGHIVAHVKPMTRGGPVGGV